MRERVITWRFLCLFVSAVLLVFCAFGVGSVERVQLGWLAAALFVASGF